MGQENQSRRFFLKVVLGYLGAGLSAIGLSLPGWERHFTLLSAPSPGPGTPRLAQRTCSPYCRARLQSETCSDHTAQGCVGALLTCKSFRGACSSGRVTCRDHMRMQCGRPNFTMPGPTTCRLWV